MKVLFVEARKKPKSQKITTLKNLPKKIHLLYTIQYKEIAKKIRQQLKKQGHKIVAFQQVLGCSKIKAKAPLLLIGSGRFHAIQLALSTKKQIFILDHNILTQIPEKELKKQEAIEKYKILQFLNSENIGLLVSLKPGQNNLHLTNKVKENLQKKFPNKNFYIFLSDNIDVREAENFPCFFINFACPGIQLDSKKIINYQKILKIKK